MLLYLAPALVQRGGPTPPHPSCQGCRSHTYLRMSFLLKNEQSCRENTCSGLCGPPCSFLSAAQGWPRAVLGERVTATLPAQPTGDSSPWGQKPPPEALGLTQGTECRCGSCGAPGEAMSGQRWGLVGYRVQPQGSGWGAAEDEEGHCHSAAPEKGALWSWAV